MSKQLRPLTAEFVGTLLFVFLGAGSVVAVVAAGASAGNIGAVGIALAHGIGMAIIVSMTMHISGGHINPAVTFGAWIADRIDTRLAGQYVLAQVGGAVVGAALVKAVLPRAAVGLALVGTPHLGNDVTFMQAVWIEAVLTFFLMSAVFGTAISTEAPKIGGFGIGLAIFVDALVGGNLTGAVMNPARAIGPALVAWQWSAHAVYWIGPLIGAGVAAALWKVILLPRSH
ncbi:MAG TPA: aquaporin [Gemmatimonadales bacterium]|jgi:MIP family channel proteins|nr:aquaporin [Gemmatimonadales bacterium]